MKTAVTLKDIAKKLNISVMTVSKAMNNHPDISAKRKKEILELAARMNYIPNAIAKSLRNRKSKLVAVIIGDNSNPYYAKVIKGAEYTLSKNGYQLIIINSDEKPEKELKLIDQLRGIHIAGVLITPAAGKSESSKKLMKYGIPHVFLSRYLDREKDNYVVADDFNAGYLAASCLSTNVKDKVFAIWFIKNVTTAHEREAGFLKAFAEKNIPFDRNNITYDCVNYQDGYDAMINILKNNKPPVSVICYSDFLAIGAMRAIRELNLKIPDDVSIIGIDGIEFLDYGIPRLSTVSLPKFRIGKVGAELLLKILNEDRDDESPSLHQIVLETQLIDRDTVK